MQAIGLIETKGLIPAIESADVMLKTSQVELIEKALVGGGLVTITVSGDVGAVKAAVDAGEAAVLAFGQEALISRHVIARPHAEVSSVLFSEKTVQEKRGAEEENEALQTVTHKIEDVAISDKASVENEVIQKAYSDDGLAKLSIEELRNLAEKDTSVNMSAKSIKKANRATLIKRLKEGRKNQLNKEQ
ncbi:BMC domain-containing protein [uncultured Enterococcus sp.]|uniref:BMC domain-containing protein n=1 Tax=uncultured Enterococcus sp. TaxID=167972 RepID=UPI002AA613BE|nr:BMC domain-containing protein [uncultured Enterococcus sp.]